MGGGASLCDAPHLPYFLFPSLFFFFRFPWVAASPRADVFVVFCVFSVQQIFLLYEEGLRILLFLFLFFLLHFLPSPVAVSLYL